MLLAPVYLQAGLLTVQSLQANPLLKELVLMGNPCTEWSGYRPYVIAKLKQLQKLVRACVCWGGRALCLWGNPALHGKAADLLSSPS